MLLPTRQFICIAFILFLCLCSTSVQGDNIVAQVVGTVYAGFGSASRAMSTKAQEIYASHVKDKVKAGSSAVVQACQNIAAQAQTVSSSISSAEENLASLTSAVAQLSTQQAAYINPKLAKLKSVVKKIKENPGGYMPKNEEEAQALLHDIQETVLNLQIQELKIEDDMSITEKIMYYFFKTINLFLWLIASAVKALMASGYAFVIMSVLIAGISIYYSFKKALAFGKVLWFFVKLPFRFIGFVLRSLWRLVFGSNDEAEAVDFEISEEVLEQECGCQCSKHDSSVNDASPKKPSKKKPAVPKKKLMSDSDAGALTSYFTGGSDVHSIQNSEVESTESIKSEQGPTTASDSFSTITSMSLLIGATSLLLL